MGNIRLILAAVLFLQYNMQSFAQSSSQPSWLWRIEKQGSSTSYLWGSFHSKSSETYLIYDSLLAYIARADIYGHGQTFFEMDPRVYKPFLVYNPDSTLRQLLDTVEFSKLSDFVKYELGENAKYIEVIQPVFLQSMISELRGAAEKGDYQDLMLQKVAKKAGTPIVELETFSDKVANISSLYLGEQAFNLLAYAENPESQDSIYGVMRRYYAERNLSGLHRIYADAEYNLAHTPADYDRRNDSIWKRMEFLLDTSSVFIELGIGHLVASNMLFDSLRSRGFKVTNVELDSIGKKVSSFNLDYEWSIYKLPIDSTRSIGVKFPGKPIPQDGVIFQSEGNIYAFMYVRAFEDEKNKVGFRAEQYIPVLKEALQDTLQYFQDMATGLSQIEGFRIVDSKEVVVNGNNIGYQFELFLTAGRNKRYQLSFINGAVQRLSIMGETEAINHPHSTRFFDELLLD